MSPEAILAGGYAVFLLAAATGIEWLSAHTHRRSLRYRTAGFTYHEEHDHWECPEGQQLWPHEFDHEQRLVRYRAKAHICNGCPAKAACTDSDHGREIVRPLDPGPSRRPRSGVATLAACRRSPRWCCSRSPWRVLTPLPNSRAKQEAGS
jgi:hypothetical protein